MPSEMRAMTDKRLRWDGEESTDQPNKRQRAEATQSIDAAANTSEGQLLDIFDPLDVANWSRRARQLIRKMRLLRFIDETTPDDLIKHLAKNVDTIFVYAGYGKTGEAKALLQRVQVRDVDIDTVLSSEYSSLAGDDERRQKNIFWTFASAFLICFFEVKARKSFAVQYYHSQALINQFLEFYPEFAELGCVVITKLLTFHLCVQVAVAAFGGACPECTIELSTRMAEGPEVALAMNKLNGLVFAIPTNSHSFDSINDCKKLIHDRVVETRRALVAKKTATSPAEAKKTVRFAENMEEFSEAVVLDTILEETDGEVAVSISGGCRAGVSSPKAIAVKD